MIKRRPPRGNRGWRHGLQSDSTVDGQGSHLPVQALGSVQLPRVRSADMGKGACGAAGRRLSSMGYTCGSSGARNAGDGCC